MRSLDGGRNVILQELSRTFTLTGEQANTLSMNRKILPAAAFDGYVRKRRTTKSTNVTFSSGPRPVHRYDAPAKVEFKKQLLLRFALSCPSVPSGVIDDCLPPSLCLRVNGKVCPLPPALPGKGGPKEGHRSSRVS